MTPGCPPAAPWPNPRASPSRLTGAAQHRASGPKLRTGQAALAIGLLACTCPSTCQMGDHLPNGGVECVSQSRGGGARSSGVLLPGRGEASLLAGGNLFCGVSLSGRFSLPGGPSPVSLTPPGGGCPSSRSPRDCGHSDPSQAPWDADHDQTWESPQMALLYTSVLLLSHLLRGRQD